MTRSIKHNPICGIAVCKSEKKDKQIINRILRHKVRAVLKTKDLEELEEFLEPKKDEIMDKWSMGKDGKQRIEKDSPYYDKVTRK